MEIKYIDKHFNKTKVRKYFSKFCGQNTRNENMCIVVKSMLHDSYT